MQDRFKFRVWIKDEKRYTWLLNLFNCGGASKFYEVEDYDEQGNHYTMYEPDEVILEQCTGLKDKNDKLIYEGDIFEAEVLNSFDGDELIGKRIRGQVSWFDIEGCFSFASYQPSDLFEIEVIGNVHENPNLLEIVDE